MRDQECGIRNDTLQTAERLPTPDSALRIPSSKGFTLIELLVVIAVLGVMLSLVIPALGELTGANLRRSARHLTGMVRFLRDSAQAKRTVYRMVFDIPAGRYWAEELVPVSAGAAEFRRLPEALAAGTGLSGGTSFRSVSAGSHPDAPFILFTPDGWVERTLIGLRDGDGKEYTLVVKPLTGDTELREGVVDER